ncbi:MAG: helix-turn-helix transcriptional regulator [Candidatus Sericytochromatia bacterium]|nr:helix-turn-helix transcriptional regulator [Candidatus Sericytochromatia bacterium]
MKGLQIYVPAAPLNRFIAYFWLLPAYLPGHPWERILPQGSLELGLNLGPTPFLLVQHTTLNQQVIEGFLVSGLHTQPYFVSTATAIDLLCVYFKPGQASALLGYPAHELFMQHLPLEVLWGKPAALWAEQLRETYARSGAQACFRVLEKLLLKRLGQVSVGLRPKQERLQLALQSLNNTEARPRVRQVCERLEMSTPQLIRYFQTHLGLRPKAYQRVIRLQQLLAGVSQSAGVRNWAELAYTFGYSDQAHLNHEFLYLTGLTPSAYAPQDPIHLLNLPCQTPV